MRYKNTCLIGATLVALCLAAASTYADVLGRIHLFVKNAADEKPIAKAKVTLRDSAGVRSPITFTTDEKGGATTEPIDARAWRVTTEAEEFQVDTQDVTVQSDTTVEAEILLEPLKEKVIRVTGEKTVVKTGDAATETHRDEKFTQKFPTNPGNRQSLTDVLRTSPGLALDSVNQLHPRGEHSSTTIYINGFQLPGAFQGRFGQILSPTAIQDVDVLTGGYAPEYGRETAAILNVNLKAGTITPTQAFSLSGGEFQTYDGGVSFGGQVGQEYGEADADGRRARRLGYLIDLNARGTKNALESPQPDDQTAHNYGQSYTSFGNIDYRLGPKDTLSLVASYNPANNQVANRTGLSDFYAPFGQGYGYGGRLGPDSGLGTQADDGQDVFQRDRNSFGVLNYLHQIDDQTQMRLGLGLTHTGLDVLNNNPAVDLNNLPSDNSIEFNPTIIRNARDVQLQGSVTKSEGFHTYKAGFTMDRQTGLESYSLTPASQAALNTLLSGDPDNPIDDPSNPLYILRPDGTNPTTVTIDRKGWYRAAYVQDTMHITPAFTANYGLRWDQFQSDQTTQRNSETPDTQSVNESLLSPRINLAYKFSPRTVGRLSYNRLMIIPPSAQGAALDTTVPPEKLNQYEFNIEHQTGRGQSARFSAYYKDIRDQLDTGLLVAGTQIGAYVTDSIPKDQVKGLELSYNLAPTQPFGFDGYLSYQYAMAKPSGIPDPFNDHDQLHTVSTGINYTFRTGEQVGAVFNYGSGFFSSTLEDGGSRHSHSSLNLRVYKPNWFSGIGVALEVENAFDQRDLLNFNSAFSGTRFQQGRRILLSLSGKF